MATRSVPPQTRCPHFRDPGAAAAPATAQAPRRAGGGWSRPPRPPPPTAGRPGSGTPRDRRAPAPPRSQRAAGHTGTRPPAPPAPLRPLAGGPAPGPPKPTLWGRARRGQAASGFRLLQCERLQDLAQGSIQALPLRFRVAGTTGAPRFPSPGFALVLVSRPGFPECELPGSPHFLPISQDARPPGNFLVC